MIAGETQASTEPPQSANSSEQPKRKKRQRDATEDLAARVQQLETMIRLQTQMQQHLNNGVVGNTNIQRQNSDLRQSDGEEDDDNDDVKSEQSAVEVAAADALGQLSKATPKEGGSEARICKKRLIPTFAFLASDLRISNVRR